MRNIIQDNHSKGSARSSLQLIQLLQLCSANFPLGSYSYSQGIEWAVNQGWISDYFETADWIGELINGSLGEQELPLLSLLFDAFSKNDISEIDRLTAHAIACRETRELREEERHRAYAMSTTLAGLDVPVSDSLAPFMIRTQLAGFAHVAVHWQMDRHDLLSGYAYSWVESQVYAALKLVPLGQSEAQQILVSVADLLANIVGRVADRNHSYQEDPTPCPVYSNPAVAFASASHETQYSRLFRS